MEKNCNGGGGGGPHGLTTSYSVFDVCSSICVFLWSVHTDSVFGGQFQSWMYLIFCNSSWEHAEYFDSVKHAKSWIPFQPTLSFLLAVAAVTSLTLRNTGCLSSIIWPRLRSATGTGGWVLENLFRKSEVGAPPQKVVFPVTQLIQ